MSLIDQAMSEPVPDRPASGWLTQVKNLDELNELLRLFNAKDEDIRRRFRYSTHLLRWLKEKKAVPANLSPTSFREHLYRLKESEYGEEEATKPRRRSKK